MIKVEYMDGEIDEFGDCYSVEHVTPGEQVFTIYINGTIAPRVLIPIHNVRRLTIERVN
jgi:hypothetical protein